MSQNKKLLYVIRFLKIEMLPSNFPKNGYLSVDILSQNHRVQLYKLRNKAKE
jgi:hypothetical protein